MSKNEELKKLRKLKGLTQKECAELICVNIRTYRRWESGESKPPISALIVFYGIKEKLKEINSQIRELNKTSTS